jgi:hypothetical protein
MLQISRSVIVGGVLLLGGLTVVAAQGRPTPAAPPTQMDELLAEIRALRKDINDTAHANMRAQLLGMRLQMQEQRIATAARQLSDVQDKLHGTEQALTALKSVTGNAPAQAFEGPLGGQLKNLETSSQQLKVDEQTMLQLLNDEQAQWARFNALIEELERAVASKGVR